MCPPLDLTLRLDRFRRCRDGTVIVILSLLLPLLAMGSVGVAEVTEVMLAKSKLQSYVDAAALQGAGEFGVDQSTATAERTRLYADGMAAPLRLRWAITSTASVDAATRAVTVRQTAHRRSFFGNLLPPGGWNIQASATAIRTARKPLCVLAIQGGSQGSVQTASQASSQPGSLVSNHLGNLGSEHFGSQGRSQDSVAVKSNSQITASNCLVQSNANLAVSGSGLISAGEARAAGSAAGPIHPEAVTDAPPMKDPFAGMAIDGPLLCNSLSLSLGSATFHLKPGVHCGAISLLGNSTLVLAPGEHYFVGGSLSIGGQTKITGSDVVVIFRNLVSVQVTGNAVLDLEGRKSGAYAGFVLITDRSYIGDVEISTANARKLLGTIYLPNASLTVSGNNTKIADQSPWTVVVARTIRTMGSANLVINANYGASTVPVPAGVGPPKGQPIRLAQ